MQTELEKLCIFANRKGEKREMTDDEKLVFGQRLKALREMRGLSQADLAERMTEAGCRITPQAIYKYEKGKMSPDSTMLIGLADALGTSPDAFLRPAGMKVEGLAFRKQSSLGVKKQKAIVTMVAEAVNRYVEIEDILGLNAVFDRSPFAMPVSTPDEAKAVARQLRKEWNLGEDGIARVIPLLEEHHVRVIEIESEEKFDGLSGWAGAMPIVIVKKEEKEEKTERKRFTALHEMGHLVLNMPDDIEDKDREKLCHQFANEVLLPESVVRERLGDSGNKVLSMQELIELQKRFGISVDAIVYKLHDMGVINDSRLSAHFRKKSNEAYKKYVEQSRIGEEHSDRFECLVYKAYAKGLISLSKTIELLGKPVEEILEKALSI